MEHIKVGTVKGAEPETFVFVTVKEGAIAKLGFIEPSDLRSNLIKAGWDEAHIEIEFAEIRKHSA